MATPRVILQSDFHSALREEGGKAWVSYKCAGKKSVHSHVVNEGVSEIGIPYVVAADGFAVPKLTERTVEITYTDKRECLSRCFVAPSVTYESIHEKRKSIYCVDVTSGGLAVSTDTHGKVKVWETTTGDVRRELEGHFGPVYTCQFFPSGIVILTGGVDMQLKIWSVETGQCAATLRGHVAGIFDTAIIDRGRNILSCGGDGTVRLWDCGTQTCLTTIENCGGNLNCCRIQATGQNIELGTSDQTHSDKEVGTEGTLLILGCDNKTLQGYGLHSRTKVFELDCHGAVNCCSFISDTCVACGTQDGHITVTDIRNIRVPLKEWKESRNAMLSMFPYRGGFFTSTGDGSCFYVNQNCETLVELCGSDCDPVYKTVTDGKFVYTACRDSTIRKHSLRDIDTFC